MFESAKYIKKKKKKNMKNEKCTKTENKILKFVFAKMRNINMFI